MRRVIQSIAAVKDCKNVLQKCISIEKKTVHISYALSLYCIAIYL